MVIMRWHCGGTVVIVVVLWLPCHCGPYCGHSGGALVVGVLWSPWCHCGDTADSMVALYCGHCAGPVAILRSRWWHCDDTVGRTMVTVYYGSMKTGWTRRTPLEPLNSWPFKSRRWRCRCNSPWHALNSARSSSSSTTTIWYVST